MRKSVRLKALERIPGPPHPICPVWNSRVSLICFLSPLHTHTHTQKILVQGQGGFSVTHSVLGCSLLFLNTSRCTSHFIWSRARVQVAGSLIMLYFEQLNTPRGFSSTVKTTWNGVQVSCPASRLVHKDAGFCAGLISTMFFPLDFFWNFITDCWTASSAEQFW